MIPAKEFPIFWKIQAGSRDEISSLAHTLFDIETWGFQQVRLLEMENIRNISENN